MAGGRPISPTGPGPGPVNEANTQFKALMETTTLPPPYIAAVNSTSGNFASPTAGSETSVTYSGIQALAASGLTVSTHLVTNTFQLYGLTSVWFSTTSSGSMTIFRHQSSSGYSRSITISIAGGVVTADIRTWATTTLVSSASGFADGAFHHVGLMYSPNAASGGRIYLFIDNVLIGSAATTSAADATGGYQFMRIGSPSPFTGVIARIRICNLAVNTDFCGANSSNLAQLAELYAEMQPIWRP